MLGQLILCPKMDMNELMCLLGKPEKYGSLMNKTWTTHDNREIDWLVLMLILCLA